MISQIGEGQVAVDIVNSTAIYMLAALAAAIGFQMNLLNIGIEGQYRIGALVAAIVGSALVLPPVLHWIVILIVAMIAGALWALLPAILKVTRGVHEVLSTIMMNAIAFGLAAYLIRRDQFGILRRQQRLHRADPGLRPGARHLVRRPRHDVRAGVPRGGRRGACTA